MNGKVEINDELFFDFVDESYSLCTVILTDVYEVHDEAAYHVKEPHQQHHVDKFSPYHVRRVGYRQQPLYTHQTGQEE